ncbi:MAG TPA: hypothetical protein VMB72_10590, partial [Acidimicrobiales bacterium]|nr:hypothetical protein [Acidimicrobiales bacterium]
MTPSGAPAPRRQRLLVTAVLVVGALVVAGASALGLVEASAPPAPTAAGPLHHPTRSADPVPAPRPPLTTSPPAPPTTDTNATTAPSTTTEPQAAPVT